MINSISIYLNQNLLPIFIGFVIGSTFVWLIWRFFFNFVYQDDNTDQNIESLEKKIDQIANHLGVNSNKPTKEN
tara:strand:- start:490 stop:711 length:222 start_codon:yes stop_codon:yes gene_type:complete